MPFSQQYVGNQLGQWAGETSDAFSVKKQQFMKPNKLVISPAANTGATSDAFPLKEPNKFVFSPPANAGATSNVFPLNQQQFSSAANTRAAPDTFPLKEPNKFIFSSASSAANPLKQQQFSSAANTRTSNTLLPVEQCWLYGSERTSRSKFDLKIEHLKFGLDEVSLPLEQELRDKEKVIEFLIQQNSEIEEKLRIEIELLIQQNSEINLKLQLMATESEHWFRITKDRDAALGKLQALLEQIYPPGSDGNESIINMAAVEADDAHSCCGEEFLISEITCRSICVCKECESRIDQCSICRSIRKSSFQIATQCVCKNCESWIDQCFICQSI